MDIIKFWYIMNWLFDRMQEPSTFAGMSAIGLAGNLMVQGNYQSGFFSLITGILAIIVKDKGKQ